jgi:hypothetical protein
MHLYRAFPANTSIALQATFDPVQLRSILQGLTPVTRMGDRPLYPALAGQSLPLLAHCVGWFQSFACAKDQASSPLDSLFKDYPIPCSHDFFG